MKKIYLFVGLLLMSQATMAEIGLHNFTRDSYQVILEQNAQRPLMMSLWSVTCSSCMKELSMLKEISDQFPEVAFISVSIDSPDDVEHVRHILQKYQLDGFSNWLFSESNTTKLRYQIDPQWFGEIPRTYFINRHGERIGISGVLSKQDFIDRLSSLSK